MRLLEEIYVDPFHIFVPFLAWHPGRDEKARNCK